MRDPSLCFDILIGLFDALYTQWNTAAMASTCKPMDHFGAKRILSFGVKIEALDALLSFYRFMVTDLD